MGGVLLLTSLVGGCGLNYPTNQAQSFVDNKGRKIIRTKEKNQADHLFIEYPAGSEKYLTLYKYFKETKKGRYDERIERAEIEKLVQW